MQMREKTSKTSLPSVQRSPFFVRQGVGGSRSRSFPSRPFLGSHIQALAGRTPSPLPATSAATPVSSGPALAAAPATQLSPLPANIRAEHARRVAANDPVGALQTVANHMASNGEIDLSVTSPATATQGAQVCSETTLLGIDQSLGASAVTTRCDCTGPQGNRKVNIRVRFGPNAVARIETLHSTLLHEFRHVRQEHAACNSPARTGIGGVCTDCNDPDDLAEIEAGYDQQALLHALARQCDGSGLSTFLPILGRARRWKYAGHLRSKHCTVGGADSSSGRRFSDAG